MSRVARIDLSGLDPRLADTAIQVACDVDNPFHGPRGAAVVFGPQKGADTEAVARLDAGLAQVARVVRDQTGVDLQELPGAGAAGGAAGGLAALLGAELTPGAPLVLEAMGFAGRLEGASLCITGEGRIDATTSAGKAPLAVAAACAQAGVPCVALCGAVNLGPGAIRRLGFAGALAIGRQLRDLDTALAATEVDLASAACAVTGIWAAGSARPT